MDLRNEQLKDTYGNLVTTGTTAGSPTSGGLQNGQGTLLTSVGIGTDSPMVALNVHDSTNARIALTNSSTGQTFPDGFELLATGLDAYLQNRSNGNMIFTTNNAERMRIDSSGNVGIGATTTTDALEIKRTGATSVSIALNQTGTGGRNYVLLSSGTGYGTAGNLVFYDGTASAERMRINSSGNVGIGTTSPASKLQVAGTIDVNTASSGLPTIKLSHTNTGADNFEIKAGTTGVANSGFSIRDVDASANRLVIDSDGNVGIGTDAPEKKLQVSGDAKIDTFLTVGDSGQANTYLYLLSSTSGTSNLRMGDTDTDAGAIIYSNASNFMDFRVNASERLRIDSSGNVGIGTSTPDYELQVGDGTATETINIKALNTNPSRIFFSDNDAIGQGRIHYEHGGDYMNFYTDNSERMRIDGSGNVGIGVSPSAKLHVEGGRSYFFSGDAYSVALAQTLGQGAYAYLGTNASGDFNVYDTVGNLRLTVEQGGNVGIGTDSPGARLNVAGALGAVIGGGASAIRMTNTDTSNYASISAGIVGTSNGGMDFSVDGTRRMVISGSGKVGIGTDSPSAPLSIDTGTTGTIAQFRGADTDILNIDGDSDAIVLDARNVAYLGFEMQGTERMRIDSSGDVLVGKTTVSLGEVGVEVKPNGEVRCTTNGAQTLQLNRLTSDGTIVDFRKDSTSIGSIGTEGGDMAIGNDDAGIQFVNGNEHFRPFNMTSNTSTDNLMDIGSSSKRFKDLYLGGSVYLGGTTSANALDDYEEGTWTATLTAGTTPPTVPPTATGTYTKIGRVVTVNVNFTNVDVSGAVGVATITGLPFTCGFNTIGSGWNSRVGAATDFIMPFINSFNNIVYIDGNGNTKDWTTTGSGTYLGVNVTFRV
jgi:hypothetical protein